MVMVTQVGKAGQARFQLDHDLGIVQRIVPNDFIWTGDIRQRYDFGIVGLFEDKKC
jgi:hypothetical protein